MIVLGLVLAGFALMTLGTVPIPALYDLLQWAVPGTTFTGRLDLWRFRIHALGPRLDGHGFRGVLVDAGGAPCRTAVRSSWDPRGIVNAHNGYLDLAIALAGRARIRDRRSRHSALGRFRTHRSQGPAATRVADFFLMVLAFTLLNAFLESFLFAREILSG